MFKLTPFPSSVISIALYALMHSSFWVDAMNLEWSVVLFKGSQVLPYEIVALFSDEMSHNAAFHLGIHSLQLEIKVCIHSYFNY